MAGAASAKRAAVSPRSGGKARELNWHNVIGVWSAIPLVLIVASGVVMSYPWANRLVYTADRARKRRTYERRPSDPRARPAAVSTEGLNLAFGRASRADARLANDRRAAQCARRLGFFDQRLSPRASRPARAGSYRQDIGRRRENRNVRSAQCRTAAPTWLRWIHTGEAGGVVGQTIAGFVSLGSAVLVWTGFALAFRRWTSWREHKQSREAVEVAVGARD